MLAANNWKIKFKKRKIPLFKALKPIKYLGINLMKDMQDSTLETTNHCWEKLKTI